MKSMIFMIFALVGGTGFGTPSQSPSQLYGKHKGFMVFLNWHFQQEVPYLVKKHYKKQSDSESWQVYSGSYGAFHDIHLGVCQNKITHVWAKTPALKGGLEPFLKDWLDSKLYAQVETILDLTDASMFYLGDQSTPEECQKMAQKVAATFEQQPLGIGRMTKAKAVHTPKAL